MIDKLKPYAKAITAFIVTWLGNVIVDLIAGSHPWPQNGPEWVRYLGMSAITALGVYGVPNKATEQQITKAAERQPDVVAEGIRKADTTHAVPADDSRILDDILEQAPAALPAPQLPATPPVAQDSVLDDILGKNSP